MLTRLMFRLTELALEAVNAMPGTFLVFSCPFYFAGAASLSSLSTESAADAVYGTSLTFKCLICICIATSWTLFRLWGLRSDIRLFIEEVFVALCDGKDLLMTLWWSLPEFDEEVAMIRLPFSLLYNSIIFE